MRARYSFPPWAYRGNHPSLPPFARAGAFGVAVAPRNKASNPVATTQVKKPINDLQAAVVTTTTPAPERATERPRCSRSDQEWEAAVALAAILHPDESVKRDEEALPFVRQLMAKRGYRFSKRGFVERIWRDARVLAGLNRLGKPGPKKNSTHSSKIRRTARNSTHQS